MAQSRLSVKQILAKEAGTITPSEEKILRDKLDSYSGSKINEIYSSLSEAIDEYLKKRILYASHNELAEELKKNALFFLKKNKRASLIDNIYQAYLILQNECSDFLAPLLQNILVAALNLSSSHHAIEHYNYCRRHSSRFDEDSCVYNKSIITDPISVANAERNALKKKLQELDACHKADEPFIMPEIANQFLPESKPLGIGMDPVSPHRIQTKFESNKLVGDAIASPQIIAPPASPVTPSTTAFSSGPLDTPGKRSKGDNFAFFATQELRKKTQEALDVSQNRAKEVADLRRASK